MVLAGSPVGYSSELGLGIAAGSTEVADSMGDRALVMATGAADIQGAALASPDTERLAVDSEATKHAEAVVSTVAEAFAVAAASTVAAGTGKFPS